MKLTGTFEEPESHRRLKEKARAEAKEEAEARTPEEWEESRIRSLKAAAAMLEREQKA